MVGILLIVADTKGEAFVRVHENAILAAAAPSHHVLPRPRLAEPDTDE